MPLQTIEPRRLYRQIADQLRGLVERGEYDVGARLPPERDLALQLGVSRPSVREALIALEVEGLVEVRMGSGIYVRPFADAGARQVNGEGPLETIRARQLIESELAAHAATHMSNAQIASLRDAVAMMQQEIDGGHTPSRGDRLFHERIAEASENSVLQRLVGELFDERHSPLFEQLGSHFETARSWTAAMAEHAAVIEAIASRSAPAARAAMAAHLSNSHDRFTANIANGGGVDLPAVTSTATPSIETATPSTSPPRRGINAPTLRRKPPRRAA
jgi:GntR family transcriptional repressor for pyruvate dehydrogenase complex